MGLTYTPDIPTRRGRSRTLILTGEPTRSHSERSPVSVVKIALIAIIAVAAVKFLVGMIPGLSAVKAYL